MKYNSYYNKEYLNIDISIKDAIDESHIYYIEENSKYLSRNEYINKVLLKDSEYIEYLLDTNTPTYINNNIKEIRLHIYDYKTFISTVNKVL